MLGADLEEQLETELDVAPFITSIGGSTDARETIGTAFLGLDKGSTHRTYIEVFRGDVVVVMIEDVVKLTAELKREPLGELEGFVKVHVDVPVVWPKELIALRVALTIVRIGAT